MSDETKAPELAVVPVPEVKPEIVKLEAGPELMVLKPAIELDVAMERLKSLQKLVKTYFVKDVDYGIIPGTDKPTLYKSGADKFCDVYGLTDTYELIYAERDWLSGRFGYEFRCLLHYRGTNVLVATGLGSCSTWEGKFRWRNGARVCPECHISAIIRGKKEWGGGWICFKKKDGCGTKFADNDTRITSQESGRIENPDIHDQINNVLKSAKKRAKVDAVLSATRTSGLFTQDLEEAPPEEQEEAYGFIIAGRLMEMKVKSNGVCALRIGDKKTGKGWIVVAHEQIANYCAKCLPHGIPDREMLLELDCVESKAPNGAKYIKLLRILKKDGMAFVEDPTEEGFGQNDEYGQPIPAVTCAHDWRGIDTGRMCAICGVKEDWATAPMVPVLEKSVQAVKEKKAAASPKLDKKGHNWPMLWASAKEKGIPQADVKRYYCEQYAVESGTQLTEKQFLEVVAWIASLD